MAERFDPRWGEAWTKYIAWSKLEHLHEVIGLDIMLCPSAIRELNDEDWRHAVFSDQVFAVFDDRMYVEQRTTDRSDPERLQLLAIAREPTEADVNHCQLDHFEFMGFELIEEWSGISALTNCGGFDQAFSASDLSACGLIPEAAKAYAVREALNVHYADEEHANCAVWTVWRLKERAPRR